MNSKLWKEPNIKKAQSDKCLEEATDTVLKESEWEIWLSAIEINEDVIKELEFDERPCSKIKTWVDGNSRPCKVMMTHHYFPLIL